MAPYLARIDIYPIKSFDGVAVETIAVLASGALQGDRAYALVDASGKFVNGKRFASMHRVRSRFSDDLSQITVWLNEPTSATTFHLTSPTADFEQWGSNYFGQPVTLQHNGEMGFPDDTDSPGPTVISTATLQTVADWYGLSLAETRRRFRSNLEIDGVPAFWEDRLFSESGAPMPFQIGAVTFWGINPCQRCIVPTRDSQTGDRTQHFQKLFSEHRAATLPPAVARSRFNHFYRLAVNTRVAPNSVLQPLTVGDSVTILE
ncbi:MOSC domain-containing protein [Leptolyngbya iicbica]|uniref:MOSC domain-containing protein n=2 Tax=Cyanophyceae TaxID=3028117 RepID=A0A4Q7EGY1_9CYAN|nr:MOSC N-terminal beta barrel domain-containing protein [Leptolyngbya sp. LK]RZM82357.1 MOSC domain-containing protein [Leptolyngbya sp. LK]